LKELFTIENKLFVEKSLCDINLKWRKSISEQLFDIHETSTYIIIRNKKTRKKWVNCMIFLDKLWNGNYFFRRPQLLPDYHVSKVKFYFGFLKRSNLHSQLNLPNDLISIMVDNDFLKCGCQKEIEGPSLHFLTQIPTRKNGPDWTNWKLFMWSRDIFSFFLPI